MTDAIRRMMARAREWTFEWLHQAVRYIVYRRRRRVQIAKAKRDDSNIYPLW